jgi:hypothetical protein
MSQPPIAEDILSFQVIPSDSAKPRKYLTRPAKFPFARRPRRRSAVALIGG